MIPIAINPYKMETMSIPLIKLLGLLKTWSQSQSITSLPVSNCAERMTKSVFCGEAL